MYNSPALSLSGLRLACTPGRPGIIGALCLLAKAGELPQCSVSLLLAGQPVLMTVCPITERHPAVRMEPIIANSQSNNDYCTAFSH